MSDRLLVKRQPISQRKLRLPESLRQQIESAAIANGRSMNEEMESRLEQSFRDDRIEARLAAIEGLLKPQNETDAAQRLSEMRRKLEHRTALLRLYNGGVRYEKLAD